MPLRLRNADVRESFGKPVIRPDDTSFVDRTTYVNGKPVGTDRIELSAAETKAVLDAPAQPGMSNGDSVGFAVLALMCASGRSSATFPDDYAADVTDTPEPSQP